MKFYFNNHHWAYKDNNLENKNFESFNIKSNKLNNYSFNNKVGFIKIDTEGNEQSVLEGATDILSQDKPNLLIEIEAKHRGSVAEDTFYFLKQYGYSGYIFDKKKLVEVSSLVVDSSINNYIFKV